MKHQVTWNDNCLFSILLMLTSQMEVARRAAHIVSLNEYNSIMREMGYKPQYNGGWTDGFTI